MNNCQIMLFLRNCSFLLVLFVFVCFTNCGLVEASEYSSKKNVKSAKTKRIISDYYCGLYSLYTVMRLSDKDVAFKELLKPDYLGSGKGSSITELEKAAGDFGMYAESVGKMTTKELRESPYPIILHTKAGPLSKEYGHFQLFLGVKNDKAMLFDASGPIELVPFSELAPRWDGNGLILSAEPINLGAIFGPARRRFVMCAAIAIAVVLVIRRAKRWLPEAMLNSRRRLLGLSTAQGAAVGIAAVFCGMVCHFANDAGLLANADATTAIQQSHEGSFIPKISEKKVHRLLDNDTVFIDARLAPDYKAGHIEGAISVPVDANDVERQKATANISKDSRIVMYCQSAGCKFAEKVAIKLQNEGYSNISIFKGGWAEWVAKNGKPKETAI